MSIARAVDIVSVRFAAPDLDRMRSFLVNFGLRDAEAAGDGVLRMRGTGEVPFIHETVQGEPAFVGLSLRVRDLDDLRALADAEKAEIEPSRSPGGGHQLSLSDPDGSGSTWSRARPTRRRMPMARALRGT